MRKVAIRFAAVFPLILAFTSATSAHAQQAKAPAPQAAESNAGPSAQPEATPSRITFADAIKRALASNPSARIADEEIRRARGLMEQARSSSLPTVYGTATYTRLDSDRGTPPTAVAAVNVLNANALLTVPIIAPKSWAQWSHAKENIDVAKANAEDIRRAIAINVGRAYLTIVVQKRLLETSTRARDTAKAHFDFAHDRLVGGVGNKLDEVRAAQELATDESSVQTANVSVVRAREALGVLVGLDGPIDNADEITPTTEPPLADALNATTKRTDVIVSEKRVRAADHVTRDNWTDLSPYLTGNFQAFLQDPATVSLPASGWQAQLILTVPFYDGGFRNGQWHERDALASEAKETLEATLRQAKSDVRAAYESVQRADDALKSARDAARLSQQALDLANLAYRAGATTNLEVIDAERRARDAETQAAVAEDTARNALLDLLAASGRFPEAR